MQMKQRAIMATALRGYSALKEICDHSFEGITYGQKSMNYFVSENARMIRSAAPYVNLSFSKGNSVSNAYIISKGTLPAVVVTSSLNSNKYTFNMSTNGQVSEAPTFGEFMNCLGATKIGDLATIVTLVDNPGGNASVYWFRFKRTQVNENKPIGGSSLPHNIMEELAESEDYDTNVDNFTPDDFPITISTTGLVLGNGTDKGNPVSQSLGIIVSRNSDMGWLRSPSTMVNLNNKFNYTEALASFPESGEKILNGGNM